jgi:hypothetical protein
MQYDYENPHFWSPIWIFSQKIWAKSVTIKVKDFTKTLTAKAVPKQVDFNYVARLLLDIEEGCA